MTSSPHVGVLGWVSQQSLKRDLLLFDQLALPPQPTLADVLSESLQADLEWLIDEGLLLKLESENPLPARPVPSYEDLDDILERLSQAYFLIEYVVREATFSNPEVDADFYLGGFFSFILSQQQLASARISELMRVRASPVVPAFAKGMAQKILRERSGFFARIADFLENFDTISSSLSSDRDRHWFKLACNQIVTLVELLKEREARGLPFESPLASDVLAVTLLSLPMPADDVPLEEVVAFLRQPKIVAQRHRLHRWLGRLGKDGLTEAEIEDEILDIVDTYREHMDAARLEHSSTWIESIVSVPADLAENVVKLRFGKLARMAFDVRRSKAKLLQAELTAPGRQVAYIVEASKRFGP